MTNPIEIGPGAVFVEGEGQQHWDHIRLLPGGVLQVAQSISWTHDQVSCEAASTVEYYAPGTWTKVRPEPRVNGTLVVDIDNGYLESVVIGTCLTEVEAVGAAAEYLRANYAESEVYADQMHAYLNGGGEPITLTSLRMGWCHALRFKWVVPRSTSYY